MTAVTTTKRRFTASSEVSNETNEANGDEPTQAQRGNHQPRFKDKNSEVVSLWWTLIRMQATKRPLADLLTSQFNTTKRTNPERMRTSCDRSP
ncbi:hypothetical protein BC938DRAFT_478985 [Jimgerdemannia flammicorona]|uniref:Uncharacterized protein n=1 Tax=Jimgerdemannia flammicorona TaxID=994334 RepID=A0A433QLV9_9FUNG|nr:hypothetical protein BC938DRAFT_478985 [Jimgerdemannia flammicorona]